MTIPDFAGRSFYIERRNWCSFDPISILLRSFFRQFITQVFEAAFYAAQGLWGSL